MIFMFKLLKDKLKSWKDKLSGEVEKTPEKEKSQKGEKPKITKKEPVKTKKTESKSKKTKKETKKEEVKEKLVGKKETQVEEHVEEEKGFLKKLFSKKDETPKEEKETEEEKSFFDKFKKKLTEEKFEELISELEMILLQNNVAYEVVEFLKKELREKLVGKNTSEINIEKEMREIIDQILIAPPNLVEEIKGKLKGKKPYVIVFVGINGSGKTTSIAKVANLLKKEKLSVCLAAADTFRSAAIEQLEIHANNLKIPLIKKEYNSDPAAVGFEAIAYAKKHGIDVVLIDTAGRINTKENLMREMEKIIRVCQPDKKIFLGESITGNDATEQARSFNESIAIDGIILSKADIDEKGGTTLSVSYITKKPILFLGTGQEYKDLEKFDKEKIIESLGI